MKRAALAVLMLLSTVDEAWADGRFWLVTPGESARLGQPPPQGRTPMAAEEGDGPVIRVKTPSLDAAVRSPVSILVQFEPGRSGLAPDMASLTVTLRGFITIDITDRLRDYVVGQTLAVEGAELPTGSHRIRLAIADRGGAISARDMILTVAEPPR
ncbi:hypothetical protein H261_05684 [Paramagnetospirillum caucaseum]|uniref:Uncharacterized protein n=1 Tax=Paramagnetospirillum caucaseum TaxID=1244869 RepID=M2Z933_9PROT|nr:hypothetical protein [Paramagnetospirillum caucaseum]EME70875.1 hypothetical protein H261_05684 [Paramagnetospirillum caucaseum]